MPKIEYEGRSYEQLPGESMLDTLVRGGANVNFSCKRGTCHVCMLQVVDGEPGGDSRKGLRDELIEHRMFLPCCAHPKGDVQVEPADHSKLFFPLHLAEKEVLTDNIVRLSFEPESTVEWRAGQFINLRRPDGVVRSYSLASIPEEDYFLTIHVKRIPGGAMSTWLCDETTIGDVIEAQGPTGACFYEPEEPDANLLLLATGTGLAPLYGLLRDALRQGHRGKICLYHGSRHADGLYLRDELEALADEHENFTYAANLTQEPELPDGVMRGRIVARAFADHPELAGWKVTMAGIPEMIEEARVAATLAGAARADIHADPFEYAHQYQPQDKEKIAAIDPDPELWAALEHGPGLTRLLTAFYTRVYDDARLSPFFEHVTMRRAIEQQYAFLADLFSGSKNFFGLKPFNAHHWMIISDELFDYRENLMEEVMREHGLAEKHIRRWASIHEKFRRDMVKSSARGMVIDGEEIHRAPPQMIVVEEAMVCDGCHEEIPAGASARYHEDGGQLFCRDCSGATIPPPAG